MWGIITWTRLMPLSPSCQRTAAMGRSSLYLPHFSMSVEIGFSAIDISFLFWNIKAMFLARLVQLAREDVAVPNGPDLLWRAHCWHCCLSFHSCCSQFSFPCVLAYEMDHPKWKIALVAAFLSHFPHITSAVMLSLCVVPPRSLNSRKSIWSFAYLLIRLLFGSQTL